MKESNWPIALLHKNDAEFMQNVEDHTVHRLKLNLSTEESMEQALRVTINKEKARIRRGQYKIDPSDEKIFWNDIETALDNLNSITKSNLEIFNRKIIKRYIKEINCKFNPRLTKFSHISLAYALSRILNPFKWSEITNYIKGILKRLIFVGHKDKIKKLAKIGTLIIIPTHYSHFDSLYAGALPHILGLPGALYGAGLNLFNNRFFGYFMNRIGTYTIDRRKKNMHYLQTLKSYSELSIKYGCNTIFYPGGGRSRDGSIESKLKLGLLSTVFEAQKLAYEEDGTKAKKIFIVPLSLSSECVVEAPDLIREYLRKFVAKRKKKSIWDKIKGFFRILDKSSYVTVGVCQPLDVYGNYVNDMGESIDVNGNKIDLHKKITDRKECINIDNEANNNSTIFRWSVL